jgi:hypothetical protein
VLCSDVGSNFYVKNGGWKACDANELVTRGSRTFTDTPSLELLSLKIAKECIDEDVAILKKESVGEAGRQ